METTGYIVERAVDGQWEEMTERLIEFRDDDMEAMFLLQAKLEEALRIWEWRKIDACPPCEIEREGWYRVIAMPGHKLIYSLYISPEEGANLFSRQYRLYKKVVSQV